MHSEAPAARKREENRSRGTVTAGRMHCRVWCRWMTTSVLGCGKSSKIRLTPAVQHVVSSVVLTCSGTGWCQLRDHFGQSTDMLNPRISEKYNGPCPVMLNFSWTMILFGASVLDPSGAFIVRKNANKNLSCALSNFKGRSPALPHYLFVNSDYEYIRHRFVRSMILKRHLV